MQKSASHSLAGISLIQQGVTPSYDTHIPMMQVVFIPSAHESSSLGPGQTIMS